MHIWSLNYVSKTKHFRVLTLFIDNLFLLSSVYVKKILKKPWKHHKITFILLLKKQTKDIFLQKQTKKTWWNFWGFFSKPRWNIWTLYYIFTTFMISANRETIDFFSFGNNNWISIMFDSGNFCPHGEKKIASFPNFIFWVYNSFFFFVFHFLLHCSLSQ